MERDYNQNQSVSGEKQGKSILSYLAQKNGQATEGLTGDIRSLQQEIEALNDEIAVLEKTSQPVHFMEFALEHSKTTAENLQKMIQLEFAEIDEDTKRIKEKHRQKIMELDAKMQKGIQYAYKIMNNMIEKPVREEPPIRPTAMETTMRTAQASRPKTAEPETARKMRVAEPEDTEKVQIIEDFWEESKADENPAAQAPLAETAAKNTSEKANAKTKDKESVTGLKNLYIIGKVAGEDLFDNSGKLIVAKNEVITEEIIDKAEKVGNLIELVLEMKLQEG